MNLRTLSILPCLLIFVPVACSEEDDAPQDETNGLGRGGEGSVVVPSNGGNNGGMGGDAAALEHEIFICTIAGGESRGSAEGDLTIDDFDDGDMGFTGNGLAGGWFAYDDGSGGSQSPAASWAPEPGGITTDGYALHVSGEGFTTWGAGQGAIFSSHGVGESCLFDASEYDGVSLWIKGSVEAEADSTLPEMDQGAIRFMLIEKDVTPLADGGRCDPDAGECWDSHRVRIRPDDCWRKLSFTFDEFEADGFGQSGGALDLDELYTFGFEIGNDQAFDYWIDDIRFFVGDKPEEEELCEDGMGGAGGGPN